MNFVYLKSYMFTIEYNVSSMFLVTICYNTSVIWYVHKHGKMKIDIKMTINAGNKANKAVNFTCNKFI